MANVPQAHAWHILKYIVSQSSMCLMVCWFVIFWEMYYMEFSSTVHNNSQFIQFDCARYFSNICIYIYILYIEGENVFIFVTLFSCSARSFLSPFSTLTIPAWQGAWDRDLRTLAVGEHIGGQIFNHTRISCITYIYMMHNLYLHMTFDETRCGSAS